MKMTPTSSCKSPLFRGDGFTLLELIIVLAIVAMGSIIVIPNLSGMTGRTFNAQVRDAVNLLNYERRTAVVSGQLAKAVFVSSVNEGDDSSQSAPELSEEKPTWQSPQITLIYRDSTDRVSDRAQRIEVSFFPEGGSTGGAIIFRQDDREAVVSIDPFSGRVRLEQTDD
jgi:general secretion pathway protein H